MRQGKLFDAHNAIKSALKLAPTLLRCRELRLTLDRMVISEASMLSAAQDRAYTDARQTQMPNVIVLAVLRFLGDADIVRAGLILLFGSCSHFMCS
jgi:hypothetical protein